MVIPLRTIFYGIPILVVGVLAALPFRRVPEPGPAKGIEQPSADDDWAIEPIEEVSAAELAHWERQSRNDPADPMKSLAESMPPIADSYQAVAVPLERPAKVADRFSAVASNQRQSSNRLEPRGPLAGRPASFASTGIGRPSDIAQPNSGWRTAVPIGRPENDQKTPGDAAASHQLVGKMDSMSSERSRNPASAEASSILPAPRRSQTQSPNQIKNSRTSHEPWPTLAELARKKRTNDDASHMEDASHMSEPNGSTNPSKHSEDDEGSVTSRVTPASSFSDLDPKSPSIRGTSDEPKTDRERFFIREPVSERG